MKLRAGLDTAEWAYDRPDVTPLMGHQKTQGGRQAVVVDRDRPALRGESLLRRSQSGQDPDRRSGGVPLHLPEGEGQAVRPDAVGEPRHGPPGAGPEQVRPPLRGRRGDHRREPLRLPRAYLVPTARVVKPLDMLDTMAHGDFDPEKVVLLEAGSIPPPLPPAAVGGLLPDAKELAKTAERWLQSQAGVADPGAVRIG